MVEATVMGLGLFIRRVVKRSDVREVRRTIILTEKQMKELEVVSIPVIEWLDINCHPHVSLIIDPDGFTLNEGVYHCPVTDYILD